MAYNVAANLRQTRPLAAFRDARDTVRRNALAERQVEGSEQMAQFNQNRLMQQDQIAQQERARVEQERAQAGEKDKRAQAFNYLQHLSRAKSPEEFSYLARGMSQTPVFQQIVLPKLAEHGVTPDAITPEVIQRSLPLFAAEAGQAPAQPEKPAEYTLGPGQARYVGDKQVASVAPNPESGARAPAGYQFTPDGMLAPIPGGPADPNRPKPPPPAGGGLPVGALRLVDDAKQAINSSRESLNLVDRAIGTIQSGKVNLGLFNNAVARGRNLTGASSEASRAFTDINQTLEKLRNNYLLLAKGVQTEGDAQRAWNSEIGESVQNDNKLAVQQLTKARSLMERMVQMQNDRIETVYANYGSTPPQIGQQPQQGGGQPVRVNTPAEAAKLPPGTQFVTPDGQVRVKR